jgi:putative GTPase activating protein for Arf/ankyrin repeat protein
VHAKEMRFFLSKNRISLSDSSILNEHHRPSGTSLDSNCSRISVSELPPQCVFNVCINLNGRSSEKTVSTSREIVAAELVTQLIKALMLPNRMADTYELVMVDRRGETRIGDESLALVEYYSRRRVYVEVTLTLKHSVAKVKRKDINVMLEGDVINLTVPEGIRTIELLSVLRPRYRSGVVLELFEDGRRMDLRSQIGNGTLMVKSAESAIELPPNPASPHLSSSSSLTGVPLMQELVKAIGRDVQNYACADCKDSNPTFVSSNLGITLCLACALQHTQQFIARRQFVSRIRPVRDYAWSPEMILILKATGNSIAAKFHRANGKHGKCIEEKYTFLYQPNLSGSLFSAIEKQSIFEVVQALQHGADPNVGEGLVMPLHLACYLECPAIIESLLRFGADPLRKDCMGHSSMFYANLHENAELSGKLQSFQNFYAFLREQQKMHGISSTHEADEEIRVRDDILLSEWLRSIGYEHTPSTLALEALGLNYKKHFQELMEEAFRESDQRSKGKSSKRTRSHPHELQNELTGPFANLSPTDFRRLMDGVLEELGMREYIAVHSQSWKQRRSVMRWLAGAHQVVVSPYGDKLEVDPLMGRRELDWMVRLQASQEKDIADSTRIVASPGMTRIGEHALVVKQK